MAGAARDMILKLVDVGREPPSSLFAAQLVREVDVDRSLHRAEMRSFSLLFNAARVFMAE
jgi:hypothetical protein